MSSNDFLNRINYSPSFSKTAREWILASALYDGIEDEDIRQIQTLLSEKGANPNVLLPEYGITPFHLVVANESIGFAVQATDICLQHGADPNVRSEDGLTPVHLSAMWGCKEVLHVLLASGGNPWLVDCFNKNAFDYAESEGQHDCLNILKTYCNTQPKPSGPSNSPYQLNLKRVVLYKNDLQIVYEASPSSSHKCASTQTSPPGVNFDLVGAVFTGKNKIDSKMNNDGRGAENKSEAFNFAEAIYNKKINVTDKNNDGSSTQNCNAVNNKLREIIVKHRRNSTIFEYPPSSEEQECVSDGCNSWKDVSNSGDTAAGIASGLIERLEYSNKIRQSLKLTKNQNVVSRNITRRKKSEDQVKPAVTLVEKSSSPNGSFNDLDSPSKIGFVLNDSLGNSTIISNLTDIAQHDKSPSIGFILDNLDETPSETRGSSLFSDIASDVEPYTTPGLNCNNFTEDENTSREEQLTRNSSSDSLYPYVSCYSTDTREGESGECFETCFDNLQSTGHLHFVSNLHSKTDRSETEVSQLSETQNIHLLMDSILSSIDDKKSTPVNPKLITSTPEKLSGESEGPSESSDKGLKDNSENQKWVEAEVISSSDDEHYMSISEEYEYRDLDEGVVLIEKHYLLNETNISDNTKKKQGPNVFSSGSESSEVSTLSGSDKAYDTDDLRRALREYGVMPGPITGNTKRVYLRKLKRCRRKPVAPPQTGQPAYSPELMKILNASCDHLLYDWSHLEDSMSASFACTRRPWREGQAKTSFTYLLLDPRLAHNLPACASSTPQLQLWADFLRAIFYVGKGKRSRPYSHLYKAVSVWQQNVNGAHSKKIQQILDIWKDGQGVVCLHVFLNIIPVEAFTREAAMISALTLQQLTNEKSGEFYGSAACWSLRLKRRLGCVLLHRAFKVFLGEGERQLRPADID